MAPVISAGVMMANIIWNVAKSRSSPSSPFSPKALKSPINAGPMPPVPKARLYPQRTQTMLTTAMAMKQYIMVLRTFRLRTSPP